MTKQPNLLLITFDQVPRESDPQEHRNLTCDPGGKAAKTPAINPSPADVIEELDGRLREILRCQGACPYSWCLEE